MEMMGRQMRFGPNEEIFGEGEPAEYVYKVQSDVPPCARTARARSRAMDIDTD
jgi:hypothetical protein